MATKRKILIQLDSDPHPSVFDRVVAVDAGAEEVFSYAGVAAEDVRELVYGAIFTRGPADLAHTAIFVGGRDVALGERLLQEAASSFFGPLRVSLMLDANGANTTAAAAVLAAGSALELAQSSALVLGATGPVGQRAARLLARDGARVRVGSRSLERAEAACAAISAAVPDAVLEPFGTGDSPAEALEGAELIVAAGAAGIVLLPKADIPASAKVLVDLNAVPPLGIELVQSSDAGVEREGKICFGAIGVGGTKMRIHKACIKTLFQQNDAVLDAEEIYAVGKEIAGS